LTVKSISSNVLFLLNEKRRAGLFKSQAIASKTCESETAPDEQEAPPDTAIPAISSSQSTYSFQC